MIFEIRKKALDNAIKDIKKFAKVNIYDVIEDIGYLVNASIKNRVQEKGAGKYKNKVYSRSYARFRKKKGRTINKRDLTFSGRMWSAQDVIQVKKGVRLFFRGVEERNKAYYNNLLTSFFQIKKEEEKIIDDTLDKALRGIK